MNTKEIMDLVQGIEFKAIGPFLVADFDRKAELVFNKIPVAEYGMEGVNVGHKTESHSHDFLSFYKSTDLDLEYEGKYFSLPNKALTLVLPGFQHSWVPKQKIGLVGSLDFRHQKQIILAV